MVAFPKSMLLLYVTIDPQWHSMLDAQRNQLETLKHQLSATILVLSHFTRISVIKRQTESYQNSRKNSQPTS